MLDPMGLVVALAGRRIDAPNATVSRFPGSNVPAVTQRIRNMLVGVSAITSGLLDSLWRGHHRS
jgi:hypothetical protein